MSTTRIHRTYDIEIDGHTFLMPFNDESGTLDNTAALYLSKDGKRALITALCQDDDCTDPLDDNEGEFIQFDHSYVHYGQRPDPEEFKRIIRAALGRVFTISYCGSNHGPGTASCSVSAGPFTVSDTKSSRKPGKPSDAVSDYAIDSADGYYIVPDDVPPERRRNYAAAVLSDYEKWCNGECYGLIRWTYTFDGDAWTLDDDGRDEVWCFIGYEYATEQLADELQYYLDRLEVQPCQP
jgi:hypothetical protein